MEMTSKRATRSRSGEDHDGGTDVIEEEMNKWRKVAEMIGETLENVCNMGHQERNQLMLLLPAEDGDTALDINEKDATIDELLGSEDEDENRTAKRVRPDDLICDEATEQSKKLKLSYQNGNNHKRCTTFSPLNQSDNINSPTSIHVPPDLSEYVATPLSSQGSTNTSPHNDLRPNLKNGFGAKLEGGTTNFSDDQLRSPIFKGRTKKEIRRSHECFGAEQGNEESELDSQGNAKLQLDSEEEEDSQNLLEQDVITSIPETPDDSTVYDDNPYSSIPTANIATDHDEKNTVAINKLLDADTLEVKMEKHNLYDSVEMVEKNKLIRNAVIDKITSWKHDYRLSDISYLKQSVSSHEECFTVMEQNPIKYKFTKVRTQVNIGLEASSHLENLKRFYTALKHIKRQSRGVDTPDLVAISTVARIKRQSNGGDTPDLVAVISGCGIFQRETKELGVCTRTTRGRARSSVLQNDGEEFNIQVDDSSDDFEDNKTAVDSDWYPDNKKQRTVKSRYPSGGKTRKPSGGSKKLFSEAQLKNRFEDSPREEQILANEKQWLGKETRKGKAIRGKKNGGGAFGRGELNAEKNNLSKAFESPHGNFIDRGIQKSKLFLKESDMKKKKERKIEDKINNPRTVVSDNLAVGSPLEESSDDDEVEVIAEVAPSPASSGRTSRSRPSSGETIRRSINAESLEALSQLGNVTVTRSKEEVTEAEDREAHHLVHNIEAKPNDKGQCPMCQRKFWMNELESHAAECQGGVNHELRRRM